jgi:uncharacterized protein YceK
MNKVSPLRAFNDSNIATHPGLRPPLQRRGAFKIPSGGGVPGRRGGFLDLLRNDISIVKCSSQCLLALLLLAAISGCSSIPTPKGSSKGYSTVRFIAPKKAIDVDETERVLTANRMVHESITAQMENHQLKVVEQGDADLVVAYLIVIQDNFSTTSINQYFGYRDDASDIVDKAHSKGLSGRQLERFKRGALVIDLIDAKTLKLVYRDFAVNGISSRDPDEVRQKKINDAVQEALASFFK